MHLGYIKSSQHPAPAIMEYLCKIGIEQFILMSLYHFRAKFSASDQVLARQPELAKTATFGARATAVHIAAGAHTLSCRVLARENCTN